MKKTLLDRTQSNVNLRDKVASEPDNSPITSSLLLEEHDIADLLLDFVNQLPATIEGMREAHAKLEKNELAKQIHDLKGVSGNYGYDILFRLCQKMEFDIHADRLSLLPEMLDEAEKIIERIRLGLPDNALPTARNRDKSGKK